jgi:hypothetical protein
MPETEHAVGADLGGQHASGQAVGAPAVGRERAQPDRPMIEIDAQSAPVGEQSGDVGRGMTFEALEERAPGAGDIVGVGVTHQRGDRRGGGCGVQPRAQCDVGRTGAERRDDADHAGPELDRNGV